MTHPPAQDEFSTALRAAIQARGLSLDRIRYHLMQRGHELSVATLSYWQSGRSRPERATSLAAFAVLEELLGVAPGELSRLLPTRRRQSANAAGSAGDPSLPVSSDTSEIIASLGLDWDDGLTRIFVHDRFEIGPDRLITARHVSELLVAERDGADRSPRLHTIRDGATTRFVAERNCVLEPVATPPHADLAVVTMLLERPLRAGEAIAVEYTVELSGGGTPETGATRVLARPVHSAHLEVAFPPGQLPLSADRVTHLDGVYRFDPAVIAGGTLHTLVKDFSRGSYGLRWAW